MSAARLFGAAAILRQRVEIVLWPADRDEYERNIALVQANLDPEAFAACWSHGMSLPLEEVLKEAFEVVAV